MSLYTSQRVRNLFSKNQTTPFKLSRSKIQNFLDCPRCFYLDRRCGTAQPGSLPFTLNSAVDTLLKKEFDSYRSMGKPHPLMVKNSINAIPFTHPDLDKWRQNFKGLQCLHEPTNFTITGAIDDLWVNQENELIIVDYKATSTSKEISLDEEYRQSYKNQMEIYQWLLRKNGYRVSKTGYFVYCNGDSAKESFEGKLEFSISVIPYAGDDSWVEPILFQIKKCLVADCLPSPSEKCDFCQYLGSVKKHIDKETHP